MAALLGLLSKHDIETKHGQALVLNLTEQFLKSENDPEILTDIAVSLYYKQQIYSMTTVGLENTMDEIFAQCIARLVDDPSSKSTYALRRIAFLCHADAGVSEHLDEATRKQLGYNHGEFYKLMDSHGFKDSLEQGTVPSKRRK